MHDFLVNARVNTKNKVRGSEDFTSYPRKICRSLKCPCQNFFFIAVVSNCFVILNVNSLCVFNICTFH